MIVLYTGRRGCGKTLTMTKDALNYQYNGWKIFSNIELGFAHDYMSEDEMLSINSDSTLNNCVLVVDEIQTMIDSRRSSSNANVDFSHFIQQIRKRNIIILCTTQFSNTVELRLRQHVDVLARPRYHKKLMVCEVDYIDMTAASEMDLWGEYLPSVSIVYDAEPLFRLYNTMKIIEHSKKKKKEKKQKTI